MRRNTLLAAGFALLSLASTGKARAEEVALSELYRQAVAWVSEVLEAGSRSGTDSSSQTFTGFFPPNG